MVGGENEDKDTHPTSPAENEFLIFIMNYSGTGSGGSLMKKISSGLFFFILFFPVFVNTVPSIQRSDEMNPNGPLEWIQGYTLVIHSHEDMNSINATRDFIHRMGGSIAVLSKSHAMLGWIPAAIRHDLIGKHGIEAIFRAPLSLADLDYADETTISQVRFFNSVASGKLARELSVFRREGEPLINDALNPQFVEPESYFTNLEDKGVDLSAEFKRLQESGLLSPGYSDVMDGTIACCVLFIESNGLIDGNSYSWTSSDWNQVLTQCLSGFSFWSSQANKRGVSVTFSLYYYTPDKSVMQQGYEPIYHPSTDDYLWINRIMANLGFSSGSAITRVTSFNAWLRNYADTDWAYSCFVAYNPPDGGAPEKFTNGKFAYAYLGGPYLQMLYKNNGWSLDDTWGVLAHESGHIFWACDEYYQEGYGGCTSCAPCNSYRPIYNGNCEHVSCNPSGSVACIMRNHGNHVCSYSARQVGWDLNQYQLEVISGAGGITSPAPGKYVVWQGDDVKVEAFPNQYCAFVKWSEAYTGMENPITITVNGNKKIFAHFSFISAPLNFQGKKVLNRSLSQAEYINSLSWQPNPKNSELTIIKYKIFLINSGQRNLVAELAAGVTNYLHRNIGKDSENVYEIVAINSDGRESYPDRITIK